MTLQRTLLKGSLVVGVLLVVCAAAFAARRYPDRLGDVKGGSGPDISSVAVSNTATTITFRVRFAVAPPLRVDTRQKWVDMLLIGIDVPPLGPRPVAPGGEWPGADIALGTHGPSKTGQLVRLGKSHSTHPLTVRITTSGRTLSLAVPRSALGNPDWFTFVVTTAREMGSGAFGGGVDAAPERGTYRYALS